MVFPSIFGLITKTAILKKLSSRLDGSTIFKVSRNKNQQKNQHKIDAKCRRKNDRKKLSKISILGWFWEGLWEGLGRFGGYKNKIEKTLRNKREGGPAIDICSWAQPI